MEWYDTIRYGMSRYSSVSFGSPGTGMVWYGMVWYGMAWYGMVWYGMVARLGFFAHRPQDVCVKNVQPRKSQSFNTVKF